jgi:hypothetical protein
MSAGAQLPQKREGLLAARVLDQLRLTWVVAAEDVPEPVGLSFDATAAAGTLEDGAKL